MVIVHAEKRASAWAAGAGAKTHNINAFVHPGGWVGEAAAFDVSVAGGGRDQESGERKVEE